jgi:hypothetical protein
MWWRMDALRLSMRASERIKEMNVIGAMRSCDVQMSEKAISHMQLIDPGCLEG